MKKQTVVLLVLSFLALGLSACRNSYHSPTYEHTDTYGEAFEGKYVPQDVKYY